MNVWSHRPDVGQMRAVKTIPVGTTAHVKTDIDGALSLIGVKVGECLFLGQVFTYYKILFNGKSKQIL